MAVISKRSWIAFIVLSFFSVFAWEIFTAPQLSFINLSVGRSTALKIASEYMIKEVGLSTAQLATYDHAIIFSSRDSADRYLQKAIGFKKELEFFKKFDFELFFWSVRFFKENQKEEYSVALSAATAEVTSYTHTIDNSAYRQPQTEEQARQKAVEFLKKKFKFDPRLYSEQTSNSQKYDKRINYSFSWEHNDSKIPWSSDPASGWAIMHTGATVSGNEILGFYKNGLKIPDQYSRYVESKQNVGWNISVLFRVFFYIILTASIFHVMIRRNNLVMHSVKNFAVTLTAVIFVFYLASYANNFQNILFSYPTTTSMASYLWRSISSTVMNTFIAVLGILMPCLAGESLHPETFPKKREGTFLYYLRTSFLSRDAASAILIGIFSAIIMIGIQSIAFEIGQRYFGVWIEYSWMTQLSANYFPFLAAFIVGITAGFSEEICFRLFGINIGKKFFKNTLVACLIASIIWGYGHSGYPVFPMWFRGLEVTCLGLFLSYIYLRFGIIAVITAHYLFDVFWESCAYLSGKASASDFYSCLGALLLPLFLAAIAFVVNKKVPERRLAWKLNVHQLFNLQILKEYLERHRLLDSKPADQLKHEIASHGWDLAVVEIAIEDLTKKKD